ncbi:MAG: hypothetical protein RBT78_10655 [Kiritimatiellia bacterium]|jgi:hypothetical protein|nr:hypothetical protein [Kiritimatiellia bacterium]
MKKITIALVLLCVGWMARAAEPVCPLIPMGAITGKPDEAVVRETLEAYKAVGVDQYLIYARSGLELEYMGEEWLQLCEWFCKHAARLGMKIWLYDEYNWPSGSCKGRVPSENKDFECKEVAVYKQEDGSYRWKIHSAPGWPDNCSFLAMKRFIELTHKRYEERLKQYMGSTIVGVFTDEPGHMAPIRFDGTPAVRFRYFDGVEQEYKAVTGRGLRADVEAYLSDNAKDEVWAVYSGLLGRRFRKAFFDPIREWCDRMGILFTGHMISEQSTSDSARYNGDPLHVLKGLTLPGMDEISTRYDPERIEWVTYAVAQHAAGRRGNGGMVELFALGPADMTHATHRQMVWLSAMHKIDRFLLAIAPLDARGNFEKHGYFNPFTRMQPWFPALRLLSEEARLAAVYATKPVRCDVAVRYPQVESARLSALKKQHPLLNGALRRLSQEQITYDVYEETENSGLPFVISFSGKTIREERSGRSFENLDDLVAFLRAQRPAEVRVETADGKLPESVLLRHYQDNSVVVLALGKQALHGLRLVRRGAAPVALDLPAQGVFVWDGVKPAREEDRRLADSAFLTQDRVRTKPVLTSSPDAFRLTLGNLNTHRLAFNSNGVACLKVEHQVAGVRIVVRDFPETHTLTRNGYPVVADEPCDTLRQGLNGLYRQTVPFPLEKGEQSFAVKTGGKDNNYFLPVAFVTGTFAVKDGRAVPVPQQVAPAALWRYGLSGYAGSVTFQTELDVPRHDGGLLIRLDTGGLYASVSLGGQSLGERAWAPFEWRVPERLRGGRHELVITVKTSVAPLFGDWKDPDGFWTKKFWVPPADPRPGTGLLAMPEWVFTGQGGR